MKLIILSAIIIIESSGNPLAYNERSKARGLCQITPIVLKEWNNFHAKEKHSEGDLFQPAVNKKIASWYLNKRIPQMLKHYGLQDTVSNRLIAYNWGIGRLKTWYDRGGFANHLPKETKDYLEKYRKLTKGGTK